MSVGAMDKHTEMTTAPVNKLVTKMAVPTIISMLVTAAYNIADTFFVGRVGTEATAGVGLIFPIMMIIQAFGFFFGQGSGNYISRALGAKDSEKADTMAATGLFSALFFGILIMLCGLLFENGILSVLGAREGLVSWKTIGYAGDYMRVIVCGAPFMTVSMVLNNQMRMQGNAFFSMIGLVSGAFLNCALDPLFIFVFDMEVLGAALATVISQGVSCLILSVCMQKSDTIKIHIKNYRLNGFYMKNIAAGGAPSLFRQGLASVSVMYLNTAAGMAVSPELSDAAIAGFSVTGRIGMLIFSAVIGFGQGFQPVCGFNYGAGNYKRVREAYYYSVRVTVIFLVFAAIVGFIFAGDIVALFRDDPNVISFGRLALRCNLCTMPLLAVIVMTNMLYQNIGWAVGATVLAFARQGLVFIPVVLILPKLLSTPIWGVYLSQPLSDLVTFIIAVPLAIKIIRELKQREKYQDQAL